MTETDLAIDPAHLPGFITAPGQTDTLFVIVAIFLGLAVLGAGALFLTVHALPERIAHRSKKLQLEIVAVLCLLALLTHQHLFWVIALVLALVDLPDFTTPIQRMAAALERMAGLHPIADPELDETEQAFQQGISQDAAPPLLEEAPKKNPDQAGSGRKKTPSEGGKVPQAKPAPHTPAPQTKQKES